MSCIHIFIFISFHILAYTFFAFHFIPHISYHTSHNVLHSYSFHFHFISYSCIHIHYIPYNAAHNISHSYIISFPFHLIIFMSQFIFHFIFQCCHSYVHQFTFLMHENPQSYHNQWENFVSCSQSSSSIQMHTSHMFVILLFWNTLHI